MTDPLESNDLGAQKRRTTRIVQAVPITVTGVDALGQPFKERTTTTSINCHGCKYQSKHYVPKTATVTLDIPRPEPAMAARKVVGRVIWVQRPRTVRELFQIGLEFDTAGNVWGIAFPPDDWFPADDAQPAASSAEIQTAQKPPSPADSAIAALNKLTQDMERREREPEKTGVAPSAAQKASTPAPSETTAVDQSKIHVVPAQASVANSAEAQAALERHVSKLVTNAKEALDKSLRHEAQAAINDEMTVVRQQLDVQLHDAVEKAIRVSMERVSESSVKKVVQDAADRTNAIVQEARKASDASVAQLDSKVRQAVEQAVTGAAEQAAQEASNRVAALNLKQAVDSAVDKALAEREASSPSLQILSSPDAAQKQIDEWKKNLEQTAQTVRRQSHEKSEQDAAVTAQRWQQEFEKAVQTSSQKMQEQLADSSRAAVEQAEHNTAARSAALRAEIEKTLSEARSNVSSMAGELAAERARAENAATELQTAAHSTVDQARRELDELLVARVAEINRRAEQTIEERARQIDPMIETAAHKAVERVSSELDQKVAAKLDQTQRAISQLAEAEQHAAQSRESIRIETQLATDQVARLHDTVRQELLNASDEALKIQQTVREQAGQASEQVIQDALARLKLETGRYPGEVEKSVREVLSHVETEFQQKAADTEHATYEALLKASEWYQKKAHTTMQSSLEKTVEQSTTQLRDRAAEVSSMVASELDHFRRTYLEHSQAEIEEAAKELVERERDRLNETAEIAQATFSDRVTRATEDSLAHLKDASRQTTEKTRSDMEFSREGVLADFQKSIDDRLQRGIEHAKEKLHSELQPLMRAVDATWQSRQRDWVEQLNNTTDESIEQYKSRLENASNSWLLASATTLGQHSQAVLDTIAKAAEKRLRDTCRDVLANMGDTLKERMMGLSSGFAEEDDDIPSAAPVKPKDNPPAKK
ncbi:MAG: hypothetical protein ACRD8A_18060 [Candidatus Acidiferrales bacterium]